MSLLESMHPKDVIKKKILVIKDDIEEIVKLKCSETFNVSWYGAYDIDPRCLFYWTCIESDEMKNRLMDDVLLNQQLRMLLEKYDYPSEARKFVFIGFESQETVDRESNGNWYLHFK